MLKWIARLFGTKQYSSLFEDADYQRTQAALRFVLREYAFAYCPATGDFIWRERGGDWEGPDHGAKLKSLVARETSTFIGSMAVQRFKRHYESYHIDEKTMSTQLRRPFAPLGQAPHASAAA